MPFEHIIDHEHRLVLVRGDGEGSMEEIADSARRLLEDQPIGTNYSFMFLVDGTLHCIQHLTRCGVSLLFSKHCYHGSPVGWQS